MEVGGSTPDGARIFNQPEKRPIPDFVSSREKLELRVAKLKGR